MGRRKTTPDSLKEFYDRLEVSPRARPEVVRAAFKALMKKYHPDNPDGDEKISKGLIEARDILLDPKERAKYGDNQNNLKGALIDRYRILEKIAEGGFGTTYKGEHILTGQPVCIKHGSDVAPQFNDILLEETRAIWDLRHYSLPVMRDMIRMEDGSLALIMSYIPGKTLEQIVEKTGRLDPEHVAWITERLLNALKYLHYNSVVHGDVKPQNIIIQPESHMVVLVDFGLSVIRPTKDTCAKGYTEFFAPPEQIDGKVILPESDFYSLGMTMLFALGGSMESVERKIVPESTPDPICEFIMRLIVRGVLERPNWNKVDLCDIFEKVRIESFGRRRSNMKPISGL